MKIIKRYQFVFLMSLFLYTLTTYLLLIRDAFILERVALALNQPLIESLGLQMAKLLKVNYSSTLLIAISFVGLFWSFWKILELAKDTSRVKDFLFSSKSKIFWIIIFILGFISFPALSTDVFDYNNINRVTFIHQADPWKVPADAFPEDDLIYLGSWTYRASVYPPVTFLVSSTVYFVFGGGFLGSLIGFKLVNICLFLIISWVLQIVLPQKHTWKVLMFSLNPLVLIEFIGNAHNDLLLGLFVLLTFVALQKKKYLESALLCALGFLAKFSLLLYVPIILWQWLKKKKFEVVYKWVAMFTLVIVLGLVPFYKTLPSLFANLAEQFSIYQKSLPTVIRYFLIQLLGQDNIEQANQLQKMITLPLFGVIMGYYLLRSKLKVIDLSVLGMSLYFFVQAPMLQPWYLVWFLPLLPFVKEKRIVKTGLVFCLSAMLTYPAYFISLYYQPLAIWWQLVLALVMIVPPMAVLWLPESVWERLGASRLKS